MFGSRAHVTLGARSSDRAIWRLANDGARETALKEKPLVKDCNSFFCNGPLDFNDLKLS